jgi:hypothetical protein
MDASPLLQVSENGERVEVPVTSGPRCPVCDARMFEMRGTLRCVQCNFAICAGCDGGTWD